MLSEEDARAKILERVQLLPARKVPVQRARGCFVAGDVFARLPLPLFDNSAMDGYAVIAKIPNGKRDCVWWASSRPALIEGFMSAAEKLCAFLRARRFPRARMRS